MSATIPAEALLVILEAESERLTMLAQRLTRERDAARAEADQLRIERDALRAMLHGR